MKLLHPDTVRGAIQRFIVENIAVLGDDVLEVGSRIPDGAGEWGDNRLLAPAGVAWIGVDMQEGRGVDRVADAHALPYATHRFSGVLCSEVLEHVEDPFLVVRELGRVVKPGGHVLLTTLTAFPIHGFPNDYWRFTPEGLRLLMVRAGLEVRKIETGAEVSFTLNNHGGRTVQRTCPRHVFGLGRRP